MDAGEFSAVKQRVEDRLEFVEIIGGLNVQFLDRALVTYQSEISGWDHPWRHFDGLRNYLLLTCFDILGQRSSFVEFSNWLKDGRYRAEREEAAAAVPTSAGAIDAACKIHGAWLDRYGPRRSFMRFIDEVLSPTMRESLLHSITITKLKGATVLKEESTARQKMEALYGLRNGYTHEGMTPGSPAGGVFPDWGRGVEYEGKIRFGWETIVTTAEKNGVRFHYAVRKWPTVLIETVRAGLLLVEQQALG